MHGNVKIKFVERRKIIDMDGWRMAGWMDGKMEIWMYRWMDISIELMN